MKVSKVAKNIVVGGAILAICAPLIVLMIWAVTSRWQWPYLLPTQYGIQGIEHIFNPVNEIGSVVVQSLLISVVVTFLTLCLTMPAVKALTLYPVKWKGFWYTLIWAPLIIPVAATGMGMHRQLIALGVANTWMGVVLVQLVVTVPYGMLMLQEVYEILGDKLEMQSRMLGATKWQTFRLVTIPVLMPAIMVACVFIFTVSFGQYFITFLIGGGEVITLPMIMVPFIMQGDRNLAAAYSILYIGLLMGSIHLFEWFIRKRYYLHQEYFK
ncbi:MAG: ABC transporter permease [Cellulosilyticaceae bacterium]